MKVWLSDPLLRASLEFDIIDGSHRWYVPPNGVWGLRGLSYTFSVSSCFCFTFVPFIILPVLPIRVVAGLENFDPAWELQGDGPGAPPQALPLAAAALVSLQFVYCQFVTPALSYDDLVGIATHLNSPGMLQHTQARAAAPRQHCTIL